MPRKPLDTSVARVRLAGQGKLKPFAAPVCRICLIYTRHGVSCQEERGINALFVDSKRSTKLGVEPEFLILHSLSCAKALVSPPEKCIYFGGWLQNKSSPLSSADTRFLDKSMYNNTVREPLINFSDNPA